MVSAGTYTEQGWLLSVDRHVLTGEHARAVQCEVNVSPAEGCYPCTYRASLVAMVPRGP